jgi:hypothetical protein
MFTRASIINFISSVGKRDSEEKRTVKKEKNLQVIILDQKSALKRKKRKREREKINVRRFL